MWRELWTWYLKLSHLKRRFNYNWNSMLTLLFLKIIFVQFVLDNTDLSDCWRCLVKPLEIILILTWCHNLCFLVDIFNFIYNFIINYKHSFLLNFKVRVFSQNFRYLSFHYDLIVPSLLLTICKYLSFFDHKMLLNSFLNSSSWCTFKH